MRKNPSRPRPAVVQRPPPQGTLWSFWYLTAVILPMRWRIPSRFCHIPQLTLNLTPDNHYPYASSQPSPVLPRLHGWRTTERVRVSSVPSAPSRRHRCRPSPSIPRGRGAPVLYLAQLPPRRSAGHYPALCGPFLFPALAVRLRRRSRSTGLKPRSPWRSVKLHVRHAPIPMRGRTRWRQLSLPVGSVTVFVRFGVCSLGPTWITTRFEVGETPRRVSRRSPLRPTSMRIIRMRQDSGLS